AREFGATDVVAERGKAATERVRELTGGLGAHSVLECVGYEESFLTATKIARSGGAIGRVGVPQSASIPGSGETFQRNITVSGGIAPVRAYIEELLPEILDGTLEPGRVFDQTVDIDGIPAGYRAMDDREAIKVLVRP
ncbi:MAG: zinc-binding dehydrogenase, partial [Solirubrobacteraceae bacterium]|nr:zinc-binding dehydrogenase [Solirubrobacteraceae bacterium]